MTIFRIILLRIVPILIWLAPCHPSNASSCLSIGGDLLSSVPHSGMTIQVTSHSGSRTQAPQFFAKTIMEWIQAKLPRGSQQINFDLFNGPHVNADPLTFSFSLGASASLSVRTIRNKDQGGDPKFFGVSFRHNCIGNVSIPETCQAGAIYEVTLTLHEISPGTWEIKGLLKTGTLIEGGTVPTKAETPRIFRYLSGELINRKLGPPPWSMELKYGDLELKRINFIASRDGNKLADFFFTQRLPIVLVPLRFGGLNAQDLEMLRIHIGHSALIATYESAAFAELQHLLGENRIGRKEYGSIRVIPPFSLGTSTHFINPQKTASDDPVARIIRSVADINALHLRLISFPHTFATVIGRPEVPTSTASSDSPEILKLQQENDELKLMLASARATALGAEAAALDLVEEAQRTRTELERRLRDLENDLMNAELRNDELASENASLKAQISQLRTALSERKDPAAIAVVQDPTPQSFAEIPRLLEQLYPGKIAFTDEMARAIGKINYKNNTANVLAEIWSMLRVLATVVANHSDGSGPLEPIVASTTPYSLADERLAKVTSKRSAGFYEGTYNGVVQYYTRHIRGPTINEIASKTAPNKQLALRIYYLRIVDKGTGIAKIVIHSLPEHAPPI